MPSSGDGSGRERKSRPCRPVSMNILDALFPPSLWCLPISPKGQGSRQAWEGSRGLALAEVAAPWLDIRPGETRKILIIRGRCGVPPLDPLFWGLCAKACPQGLDSSSSQN